MKKSKVLKLLSALFILFIIFEASLSINLEYFSRSDSGLMQFGSKAYAKH